MILKIMVMVGIFLVTFADTHAATYTYRVSLDAHAPEYVRGYVSSIESKSDAQPYLNTNVHYKEGEDHFFFTVTPKDGVDFKLEKRLLGVALYKISELEDDGFFKTIVDNSNNWAIVQKSSGQPAGLK